MTTFEKRLSFYKDHEDFFLVDIFKGGIDPYETKRDLTWSEAKRKSTCHCKQNSDRWI